MANLLGAVVVTHYNNKSYRVDDIAWDINPLCKFPYKGKEISYVDFYETVSVRLLGHNVARFSGYWLLRLRHVCYLCLLHE